MFQLHFIGQNGYENTLDLSKNLYDLFSEFRKCEINDSPFYYKIGDTRGENSRVKISSDSDFGNAALKLLQDKDKDTIYDAYQLEQGLLNVRDELKDDIEQNVLYEQYQNTKELFADIRQRTIDLALVKVVFYCPLLGNVQNAEDGYYEEVDNYVLKDNMDTISEYLKKQQSPELNMAEYVGGHSGLEDKLVFAEWSVEEIDGTLYGKIECLLMEPLDHIQTENLRNAVIGQNSDGFGEGFEQKEIPIDEGNLYVSFWNSGEDYFLYTEDELNGYLGHDQGMTFGGM
jgi:hypothetical protein